MSVELLNFIGLSTEIDKKKKSAVSAKIHLKKKLIRRQNYNKTLAPSFCP